MSNIVVRAKIKVDIVEYDRHHIYDKQKWKGGIIMKILVVIDMQYDFIDGTLGSSEAVAMLPKAVEKIKDFHGRILATKDTHEQNYLETQEGKLLPIQHCIRGTNGWQLHSEISKFIQEAPIDKPTFGSVALGNLLTDIDKETPIEDITLIGLCTDICVISNAMLLKAFLPQVPIIVDASCCAGVTPATHRQALETMKLCQIQIINE